MAKKSNIKELDVKKEVVKLILKAIIKSVVTIVILYFCVTTFNESIVQVLEEIKNQNLVCDFLTIVFPIILIINLMFLLGQWIATKDLNPKVRK